MHIKIRRQAIITFLTAKPAKLRFSRPGHTLPPPSSHPLVKPHASTNPSGLLGIQAKALRSHALECPAGAGQESVAAQFMHSYTHPGASPVSLHQNASLHPPYLRCFCVPKAAFTLAQKEIHQALFLPAPIFRCYRRHLAHCSMASMRGTPTSSRASHPRLCIMRGFDCFWQVFDSVDLGF